MRPATRVEHHASIIGLVRSVATAPDRLGGLSELSRRLAFSPDHLNKLFKDITGEPLIQFVRRIKLERAAQSLRLGVSVQETYVQAGFSAPEAFSKAFHRAYGLPPSAFQSTSVPCEIACQSGIHWGCEGLLRPLLAGAEDFGFTLINLPPVNICAIPFVGDYTLIPARWQQLADEIPPTLQEAATWVTLFHDDGMKTKNRDTMRSYLGFIEIPTLPNCPQGFERIRIEGGAGVTTDSIIGPKRHSQAWRLINQHWVPKQKHRFSLPGYDIYNHFPSPWETLVVKICLGLHSERN